MLNRAKRLKPFIQKTISWSFCLLAPWVASSVIYFAAQEQWSKMLGTMLVTSALSALGIEGIMRSAFVDSTPSARVQASVQTSKK